MRKPVKANSKPAAYVYNCVYKGYAPLYKRKPVQSQLIDIVKLGGSFM